MAEIFVSYARSTAAQAQQIAEALRGLGYGVWRDDELPAHRSYADVIEERLKVAKAVVVIWSAEAVRSEWVQSEADRARNDRKLVQLTVDGTSLPMPFDRIQCADLSGWSGDLNAPGWRKVVASIADLIGAVSMAQMPSLQKERQGVSICVLPFANMSDDREQEYFSDGISEDIITDLSKVSALSVIARNTAFTFKAKSVDVKQVARQLEVSHVLEGSVRKSGNRVRITAQLIDGKAGDHVWAERYDRDLADIFALQDEISEAIVAALKIKLLPEEKKAIEDRGTKNLEAYDLYLRANSIFGQMGYENLSRLAPLLRQALALDPAFSLARAKLVTSLRALFAMTAADQAESLLEETKDLIEGGILEAKDLADAHRWRAVKELGRRDFLAAERAIDRVIALDPAPDIEFIGLRCELLRVAGRLGEDVDITSELVRNDPLSLYQSTVLQLSLTLLGRLDEAEAEYRRSQALEGDRGGSEWMRFLRIWPHSTAAERKEQFQRMRALGTSGHASVARLEDALDRPDAAPGVLRQIFAEVKDEGALTVGSLAVWAGLFGDTDLALDFLYRAYVDLNLSIGLLMWQAPLAKARRHPRFKELVRELGIYDYWKKSGKWGDFARPMGDDDFEIIR